MTSKTDTLETKSYKSVENKDRWLSYLFCAPAIFLMFVILIVPIFIAAILSFTDYSLGNPDLNWIGDKNYDVIFGRSAYQKMLWASVILRRRFLHY